MGALNNNDTDPDFPFDFSDLHDAPQRHQA
jgi:hypothetical protein